MSPLPSRCGPSFASHRRIVFVDTESIRAASDTLTKCCVVTSRILSNSSPRSTTFHPWTHRHAGVAG